MGFLLGPPTGGLLYQLGGFRCPFLVTAALLLLLPAALLVILRRSAVKSGGRGRGGGGGATRDLAGAIDGDVDADDGAALVNCVGDANGAAADGDATDDAAGSDGGWGGGWGGGGSSGGGRLLTLLRIPAVLAALTVQSSVFLSISAFDPVFQPFLSVAPLSLTPVHVGLLLALAVLAYAIVSVISGPAAERLGDVPLVVCGLGIAAASLFCVGPSPLLTNVAPVVPQHSLGLYTGTIACFGVGMGLTVAPTTNLMVSSSSSSSGSSTVVPTTNLMVKAA